VNRNVVWLIVGVMALGGSLYLCAIDKLSSEVVATILGVIAKGFVDALGGKGERNAPTP